MSMTTKHLIEILGTLPEGSGFPIVKGRNEPEVFASIPPGTSIPYGWTQAHAVKDYYPEGWIRVKWAGLH